MTFRPVQSAIVAGHAQVLVRVNRQVRNDAGAAVAEGQHLDSDSQAADGQRADRSRSGGHLARRCGAMTSQTGCNNSWSPSIVLSSARLAAFQRGPDHRMCLISAVTRPLHRSKPLMSQLYAMTNCLGTEHASVRVIRRLEHYGSAAHRASDGHQRLRARSGYAAACGRGRYSAERFCWRGCCLTANAAHNPQRLQPADSDLQQGGLCVVEVGRQTVLEATRGKPLPLACDSG